MSSVYGQQFRRYAAAVKGYMNLKELAEYLDVKSVGSLRTQIKRGALKAERVSERLYLVSDEEARRYKEQNRAGEGKRGRPPKPKGGTP
jgi:hypothetical protein